MATTPKTTAKKTVAKKAPAKKVAAKKAPAKVEATEAVVLEMSTPKATKMTMVGLNGKYLFATGRRKTAVANVRLFEGSDDSLVNKKSFSAYFSTGHMRDEALRPLALSGLMGEYFFTATINGGGKNAQIEALRHAIAQALASTSEEMQKLMKRNGFLTRDDRKKERKKPGLRGARRSPQWAKR